MSNSYSLGRVQRRKPISILHGCTRKGISFYYDYDHDGLGWTKYGTSHSIFLPVLWLKNDHFQPPDAEVIFSLNCIMIICLFLRVRCVGGGGKIVFHTKLQILNSTSISENDSVNPAVCAANAPFLWRPGNKKSNLSVFSFSPTRCAHAFVHFNEQFLESSPLAYLDSQGSYPLDVGSCVYATVKQG